MASNKFSFILLFLLQFATYFILTIHAKKHHVVSLSFPLTSLPLSKTSASKANFLSSLFTDQPSNKTLPQKDSSQPSDYNYQSPFKYSMALIVSLPIGTPPQNQPMVLDTGSQLSWIQCNRKKQSSTPPTTSFDPSLSSSFSIVPCTHPLCKPRIPDFTLPTTCDQNRLCHYSYFYADGTLAEGNLVREKLSLSASKTTPPLILGCASESGEAEGILGMNLGRLSFISQAKVPRFSYCVPLRQGGANPQNKGASAPTGAFYLGQNPHASTFRYVSLLTFPQSQRMPNFDPLAYSVGLTGIRIGGKKLDIPPAVFRPDSGGSSQTMIDSGTQYTFLVDAAYAKVREEVVRVVGPRMKKGFVYGGALDMCFDGSNSREIGRLIGDVVFEFEKGVEMVIGNERNLDDVGGGVHCVAIGRSESLGVASNIIGNFHQQNLWVEFDVSNRRVGFGVADCSRAL